MNRKTAFLAFAGFAVIVLLSAYGLRKYSQRDPVFMPDMPGKPAPAFNLPTVTNGTAPADINRRINLEDYRGKTVLLNFWASWCPPCQKEIPALIAIQKRYRNENFTIVSLAMEEKLSAAAFARENSINYPVAYGLDETSRIATAYGNPDSALPYSVLINPQQTILAVYPGLLSEKQLANALDKQLRH